MGVWRQNCVAQQAVPAHHQQRKSKYFVVSNQTGIFVWFSF